MAEERVAGDRTTGEDLIRRRTASGFAFTLSGQVVQTVGTLASAMILARLLGPEAYGLMGLVTVVTGLLFVYNEVGLSHATVQKERLTSQELDSIFWLQLVLSLGVAALTCAAAPVLAWVYGEPRLAPITLAMAPSFVLMGLYAQPRALLRRAMRHLELTLIEVSALLCASVAAIVAALSGAGYWALVVQSVGQFVVRLIGFFVVCAWRPGRPRIDASVADHVRFGRSFFGYRLLEYVASSADRALLGLHSPTVAVGLYERATSILAAPMSQIAQPMAAVLMPALSRLQLDPGPFSRLFTRYFKLLAWATLPLLGFLIATAEDLVRLLLGPEWTSATEVFLYASVGAALMPLASARNWLFLSLGRTPAMLRLGAVAFPVLGLAYLVTAPRGPTAVAAARSAWAVAMFVVGLLVATRGTQVSPRDLASACAAPLVAAVVVAVVGRTVPLHHLGSLIARLLVQVGVAAAVVLTVSLASGDARRLWTDFVRVRAVAKG